MRGQIPQLQRIRCQPLTITKKFRGSALSPQARQRKFRTITQPVVNTADEHRTTVSRKNKAINNSGTNDTNRDFFHTPHGIVKCRFRSGNNSKTGDRHRVTGKHEQIAARCAVKQADDKAKPHPEADSHGQNFR